MITIMNYCLVLNQLTSIEKIPGKAKLNIYRKITSTTFTGASHAMERTSHKNNYESSSLRGKIVDRLSCFLSRAFESVNTVVIHLPITNFCPTRVSCLSLWTKRVRPQT